MQRVSLLQMPTAGINTQYKRYLSLESERIQSPNAAYELDSTGRIVSRSSLSIRLCAQTKIQMLRVLKNYFQKSIKTPFRLHSFYSAKMWSFLGCFSSWFIKITQLLLHNRNGEMIRESFSENLFVCLFYIEQIRI